MLRQERISDRDEASVAEYLRQLGLRAEPFCKASKRASKTPDFKVFRDDDLAFFCEVKSAADDNVQGSRNDPTYNRIEAKVYEAIQQFDAVNPSLDHPNVLFIVNHDRSSKIAALTEVLTGYGEYEGEHGPELMRVYGRWSDGRIREGKERIGLCVWVDHASGVKQHLFNSRVPGHPEHYDRLCECFGHVPGDVSCT